MIVAYTIGHTKSYKKYLAQDLSPMKLGKKEGYDGGWIWKTEQAAKNFINSQDFLKINWGDGKIRDPADFSVFRVILENGWDDISPLSETDDIYYLLNDSRIMEIS